MNGPLSFRPLTLAALRDPHDNRQSASLGVCGRRRSAGLGQGCYWSWRCLPILQLERGMVNQNYKIQSSCCSPASLCELLVSGNRLGFSTLQIGCCRPCLRLKPLDVMPPPYPIQVASIHLPKPRVSSHSELTLCRRRANSNDHIISMIGSPLTGAEHS